jgi:hypothetical protein
MDCDFRKLAISIVAICLSANFAGRSGWAAVSDDFEGPQVTWQPDDADVRYQMLRHQRIVGDAHSGQGSELIQIAGGPGSFVYLSHDIGTARIVAELLPRVWIKADRPGMQLLARVVLPHTIDPRSGKPATVLIRGTGYTATGAWQMLQITDTPLLLTRQLRVLQAEMKPQVDPREAYIDQLLLNVYGGPGETTVNVDDLEIAGVVARDEVASILPSPSASGAPNVGGTLPRYSTIERPAFRGTSAGSSGVQPVSNLTPVRPGQTAPEVALNGSLLEVNGRPMFPRIIQAQGEPLAVLKNLGFNAVRTNGQLTDSMLAEARQAGIWLIGPPPLQPTQNSDTPPSLAPINSKFDQVLAWHLGAGLATREISSTTQLAKQLRQSDRELRRPLVCNPEESLMAFSRQVDLLSICRNPLGSSLELKNYGTWLAERPRLVRPGTPLWAVVQTEPAPTLIEQAAELSGHQAPEPAIDPEVLRLLVYQSFSAGARGIEFASNGRLDAGDSATRNRATALALLNLEMQLLEPWEAAGSSVGSVTSNDPNISGVVFSADSARLVVAMRSPWGSQFVAAPATSGTSLPPPAGSIPLVIDRDKTDAKSGDGSSTLHASSRPGDHGASANTIQSNRSNGGRSTLPDGSPNPNGATPPPVVGTWLKVPGIPEDNEFYELSPVGLKPLRHRRVSGGTSIAIDDFSLTALVLITPDPLVANSMSRRAAELAPQAARLQREMTAALLAEVETVDHRLVGQTQLPPAAASLAEARAELQRADQLLAAGNAAPAYRAARNAAFPLSRWRREVWERTVKPLTTPLADPLAVTFNTLPDELMFRASLANLPPAENLLPGGDCENLPAMLQAGWHRFDHPQPDLQNDIELSPYAPYGDRMSLHLQVRPRTPDKIPTVVESSPLWITTAPVHVQAGEAVCIRGKIRMSTPVNGSVDSLLVIDSLGGEALSERIPPADGWREFVMYRAAPRADNLTVTFALTGIGEAWIDNVTIQPIRRAAVR